MEQVESKASFTLDGVEYNFDEISDPAKYLVSQLELIAKERHELTAKADMLNMAEEGFAKRLKESLEEVEEVEKETGA